MLTPSHLIKIDYLRAFAVISVIAYHLKIRFFEFGYLGVDVFFVISGFLITRIIIRNLENGTFSLAEFYLKRARRIAPALFMTLGFSSLGSFIFFTPSEIVLFCKSLISSVIFLPNVFFFFNSNYFGPDQTTMPLLHTWSLGVEEQFYLFYPIMLMLIWRLKSRIYLLALISIISFTTAFITELYLPNAAFYLFPTRAWELMLGGLLTFISPKVTLIRLVVLIRIVGLSLILSAFYLETFLDSYNFRLAFVVIGTALLILEAALLETEKVQVSRLARLGSWLGLISYSAYLIHQPIIVFLSHSLGILNSDSIVLDIIVIVSIFLLASLSYIYIETPFRNEKVIGRRSFLLSYFSCFIVLLSVAFFGIQNQGLESHYLSKLTQTQKANYELFTRATSVSLEKEMIQEDCLMWNTNLSENFVSKFNSCRSRYGKAILVLGDSHAMNLYNALAVSGKFQFLVGLSQGNCRPYNALWFCQYEELQRFLQNSSNEFSKVIFHQSGSYFIKDSFGAVDSDQAFMDAQEFTLDELAIKGTSAYLKTISQKVQVLWLGPFTEPRTNLEKSIFNENSNKVNPKSQVAFALLDSKLKENSLLVRGNFDYASLVDLMGPRQYQLISENCFRFRDKDHLSRCGEVQLSESLMGDGFLRIFLAEGVEK
jgi:peptidoglycan/LPS O-acetylase OafA/YrhL